MRFLPVLLAVGLLGDKFPPRDFVEYWSAARVLQSGGNPYDHLQLLEVQRSALNKPELQEPTLLWTPPYTLPVYLPFGYLPFETAHVVWVISQLVLIFASMVLLSLAYRATPPQRFLGWLMPLVYAPVFWCLHFGQNTALLLFGLSGFLLCRTRNRPWLAGLFAALTAIKPHMLAAFGIVLVLDAYTRSGRRALLSGVLAIAVALGIVFAFNANIISQFQEALNRPTSENATSLKDWDVPLLSYQLRVAIAPDAFWVQFVPCGIVCILAAVHYWRNRRTWNWLREMPMLVLLSAVFAPYGGWIFDMTILLLPIFAAMLTMMNHTGRKPLEQVLILALTVIFLALSYTALKIHGLADSLWHAPLMALLVCAFPEFIRRSDSAIQHSPNRAE